MTRRHKLRGEEHHRARLSDREVELLRILHEREGWPYSLLMAKFEVSKTCVAKLCRYQCR